MKLNRSILAAVVVIGSATAMAGCAAPADQDQDVASATEQVGAAATEAFNAHGRWEPRGERARERREERREHAWERGHQRRGEMRREHGWRPYWRRFRSWWGR